MFFIQFSRYSIRDYEIMKGVILRVYGVRGLGRRLDIYGKQFFIKNVLRFDLTDKNFLLVEQFSKKESNYLYKMSKRISKIFGERASNYGDWFTGKKIVIDGNNGDISSLLKGKEIESFRYGNLGHFLSYKGYPETKPLFYQE